VRLSDKDKTKYERLLSRYVGSSLGSDSERFRLLLEKLDFPYETKWDCEGWEFKYHLV